MTTLLISIIASVLLFLNVFAVFFSRYKSFSKIVFSLSLISIAAVIFSDSMCIYNPEKLVEWKRTAFISEAIMAPVWLLFSLVFARTDYWKTINKLSKLFVLMSPLVMLFFATKPIESFFYSPEFSYEKILFLENTGYGFNIVLLIYSVLALINFEATLRSSSGFDRWRIKYALFGAGGILAINIFHYSHALLYRSIDMNMLPVRSGIVLISALFIGYSILKNKNIDVEIAVSRKVLYKSVSVLVIGVYLLGLGLLGEGMRYLGPQVGKNITIFLGFVGAIAIAAVIFSEQLRRKVVVIINKNFYSQKYDYRDEWLKFTQRISLKHSDKDLLTSVAQGFIDAIGSKGAAVWLKESGNGDYKCTIAIESAMNDSQPDKELISYLENKKWVLNVNDPECNDVVAASKEFLSLNRAFLIVPLLNINKLIGFIILIKGLVDKEYNYEDYDLLKTLASQAAAAILNARLSEELIEAKELEAMGRLSSFVIHDLKNASSKLSLLAQNAKDYMDNPEFQRDAIKAISNTASNIQDITEKLNKLPRKKILNIEYSDLKECVVSAVNGFNLNNNIKLSFKDDESIKTRFDKEEITKVIVNLLINSLEASDGQSAIQVIAGRENDRAFIKVSDNGCGMSSEFIDNKLFRPFHTTKKKGLGIGLYQCKTIIEEHSGRISVNSEEGKGTDFTIYLPIVTK
jgi:putative PEP-CTERM system histidine kinase